MKILRAHNLYIAIAVICLLAGCSTVKRQPADAASVPTSHFNTSLQQQLDLGARYLQEQNYEQALVAYTAAIEFEPDNSDLYVQRGQVYALMNQYPEAESDYTMAIELNTQNAVAYSCRGNLYLTWPGQDNFLSYAYNDFVQAIMLDETLSTGYIGLANVCIQQDDFDGALDILHKGLEVNSGDEILTRMIASLKGGGLVSNGARTERAVLDDGTTLVNEYDEHGNNISTTKYNPDGTLYSTTTYEYNTDSTLLTETYTYNDNQSIITDVTVYEYDTKGNVVKRSTNRSENGAHKETMVMTFEYGESDKPIKSEYYYYDASGSIRGSNVETYDYDESGMLIRQYTVFYDENGQYDGDSLLEFKSDSNNR